MPKIRTSRRVPPLKDSDYDHEIALIDDAPSNVRSDAESDADVEVQASGSAPNAPDPGSTRQESPLESQPNPQSSESQPEPQPTSQPESQPESQGDSQLDPQTEQQQELEQESEAGPELGLDHEPIASSTSAEAPSTVPILNNIPPTPGTPMDPSTSVNNPNRPLNKQSRRRSKRASNASRASNDSAIDILYENERGGILCGIPLFSCRALGNLDPTPWTNSAHKASLTNTNTATVPDPSWEWAWPEWKVNHDVGVDKDGWEYSFMFSKKFSWHGPKWWNSFVRRRAWIRRRTHGRHRDSCEDEHSTENPCLLNTDYFTVRSASQSTRSRSCSMTSKLSRMSSVRGSMRGSRASLGLSQNGSFSSAAVAEEIPDIFDIEMLLAVLKCSRIDREKIEAIENYLQNGGDDVVHLQEAMHDIMALFIFQSSRQILLSRLMQVYDETKEKQKKDDSPELEQRAKHLSAAVNHADEEVRKLEYWSDIKGMAERGESRGAVDSDKGWDEERFKNMDLSAPAAPPNPKPGDKDAA